MDEIEARDEHDNFKKLCALAQLNALSAREQLDLDRHLQACNSCRLAYEEYCLIGTEGMAFLNAESNLVAEAEGWDSRRTRESLFVSIRRQGPRKVLSIKAGKPRPARSLPLAISGRGLSWASLAACTIIALTLGAYRMGERANVPAPQLSMGLPWAARSPAPANPATPDPSAAQTAKISKLEQQISGQLKEIAQLRAASALAEKQVVELGSAKGEREADLRQRTEERDQLATRLADSEKAYQVLQADYSSLRAEHSRSLLQAASLESEVTDLRASSRDQDRRLKDDEQYLTSDRDIRELMGARKLYIADVFDVDSVSRTRKPFGRVFYTQNKSLVFYAFDLDHQPGVKNAGVFQVWGQRDAEANGAPHAMNLGILYMDSESNRRWGLRSDDPKQLAEIDAVFVTVEPHGGSQKPTGKPLLYALLRKEANHP